jgi:hypoxanthine phosphoribosyltransferase
MDFLAVSSYGDSTSSTGVVKITKDMDADIFGKNVLLVEDIVDTGLTLKYLKQLLTARGPASLKICTMFDKPSRRKVDIKTDYCGIAIPDRFVVGYGLDYRGMFRNLPDLCVIAD